jgi:hypothetical protein
MLACGRGRLLALLAVAAALLSPASASETDHKVRVPAPPRPLLSACPGTPPGRIISRRAGSGPPRRSDLALRGDTRSVLFQFVTRLVCVTAADVIRELLLCSNSRMLLACLDRLLEFVYLRSKARFGCKEMSMLGN